MLCMLPVSGDDLRCFLFHRWLLLGNTIDAEPKLGLSRIETADHRLLQRVLLLKKSVHLADTREESDWRENKAIGNVRSWIAVPLVVSDDVLGLLSIGKTEPRAFTPEHFRLAKSLAVPAAVAIHNARLYEWAQIYAAERQTLLKKINETPESAEDDAPPPGRRFTN
jgi:GAF domain-containing protein